MHEHDDVSPFRPPMWLALLGALGWAMQALGLLLAWPTNPGLMLFLAGQTVLALAVARDLRDRERTDT